MSLPQGKKPAVLLIEADASLRRLIALGLQHRGMHVIEADSPSNAATCDTQQPDLLVLDVDGGVRSNWTLLEAVRSHPLFSTLPVVVLFWENRLMGDGEETRQIAAPTTSTQVTSLTKPFDARILYNAIDQLLRVRAENEAAAVARAEEVLLASYSSHTAPSIWPVVTAAGLLLAVIGLLLQIVLAAAGFLIVIVALLLWTLGTKSEAATVKVSVGV